jgi:hypothetical protein
MHHTQSIKETLTSLNNIPFRFLYLISIVYVCAPCLVFLLGYLKYIFSIPLAFVIVTSIIRQTQYISKYSLFDISFKSQPYFYVCLVILCAIIILCSGIGGFTQQDGDYYKHNAMFRDLMDLDWPPGYQEIGSSNKPGVLNAYVGYYLPSALFGKIFGLTAGFVFSFLWGTLGLFLTLFWFMMILGKGRLWLALLFVYFGGVDILGHVLVYGRWPSFGITTAFANWMHPLAAATPLNGLFWIFPPNLGVLANGPHHVLPSWVILLIMMYDAIHFKSSFRVLFLWGLVSYVSVFFCLGMIPYVGYCLLSQRKSTIFSLENCVVFPLIAVISFFYYASSPCSFPKGFIWQYQNILLIWQYLVLFYICSIGLYLLVFPISINHNKFYDFKPWFILSILCIVLFPLYKMGDVSEFPIKSLLPSVVVFLLCFSKGCLLALNSRRGKSVFFRRTMVVMLLGSFAGIYVTSWGLYYFDVQAKFYKTLDSIPRVNQLEPRDSWPLYLFSDGNSFFWRNLAKNAKPLPN